MHWHPMCAAWRQSSDAPSCVSAAAAAAAVVAAAAVLVLAAALAAGMFFAVAAAGMAASAPPAAEETNGLFVIANLQAVAVSCCTFGPPWRAAAAVSIEVEAVCLGLAGWRVQVLKPQAVHLLCQSLAALTQWTLWQLLKGRVALCDQ